MIKKGDFIELDYVGKITDTSDVFDLTSKEAADKYNIHNEKMTYGPRIIIVGEGNILPGIDIFLEGKECKEYTFDITPDKAFGKKDSKLLKLVPAAIFKKQNIRPTPGLQLNIDGRIGTVRTVSGGRITLDFNHPLAGRNVTYELKIHRIVTDDKEKLKTVLQLFFGKNIDFTLDNGNVFIDAPIPEELANPFKEQLTRLIPRLKDITFKQPPKTDTPKTHNKT